MTLKIVTAPEKRPDKYPYSKLLPHPYSNVLIIARKRSGKSSLIRTILLEIFKHYKPEDTEINIFSPTSENDPQYKNLTYKGNPLNIIHHLSQKPLPSIVDTNRERLEAPPRAEKRKRKRIVCMDYADEFKQGLRYSTPITNTPTILELEQCKPIIRGDKVIKFDETPKHDLEPLTLQAFVFDDLGQDTRDNNITHLYKTNRHNRAITLTAVHSVKDVYPSAYTNMNIIILMSNLDDTSIEHVIEKAGFKIDIPMFLEIYRKYTAVPYSYVVINTASGELSQSL